MKIVTSSWDTVGTNYKPDIVEGTPNSKTTRRTTFNLKEFLEELSEVLISGVGSIEDQVNKYKEFLSRTEYPLRASIMNYVNRSEAVRSNKRLRSFTNACHMEVGQF